MKSLQELTTVLFLVLVVGSFLCPSSAWIRWRRRRRRVPPVRRPQPPRTSGRPPYCPLDAKTKLITQRRFGRELHEFKRGLAWPYNCDYASILKVNGKFNYLPLIRRCCDSCSFPSFSTCARIYGGTTAGWRCPAEGFQCIFACVRKHDPNTKPTIIPRPSTIRTRSRMTALKSRRYRFSKKITTTNIVNSKCERKVLKGGKFCTERLCIPIKVFG